jgi:hypothetical protein
MRDWAQTTRRVTMTTHTPTPQRELATGLAILPFPLQLDGWTIRGPLGRKIADCYGDGEAQAILLRLNSYDALLAALQATQRHFDEAMSEGVDADAICAIRELVQDALAAADHHKGD